MFTSAERKEIEFAFNLLVSSPNPAECEDALVLQASRGIDPCRDLSKVEAVNELMELHRSGVYPIINDDSTSAWMHEATLKYGLTVADVRKMTFGEQVELVLMDANVGDYTHGMEQKRFDPSQVGFSYGTYIHGEDGVGLLNLHKIAVVHAPFRWEVNLAALGGSHYWGRLPKKTQFTSLDPQILVGWRGPCIRYADLNKLPTSIRLHENWFNDYGIPKYNDWLHRTSSDEFDNPSDENSP